MYQQHCEKIWQHKSIQNHKTADLSPLLQFLQQTRKTLPLFQHIDSGVDLAALQKAATPFQKFTDVIILGTGGSSLGGQSLYSLIDEPKTKLHFHDNIDPHTFKRLFATINPATTGVIAISKSGNTSETLMQLLVCLNHWQQADLKAVAHFLILTEATGNAISEVATAHAIPTVYQPNTIGGRFAVFTIVGLLPALIAGFDIAAFLNGSRQALDTLSAATEPLAVPAIEGAYLQLQLSQQGIKQSVLIPYIDRLSIFALWYRQLWAESLGKGGLGTTPIQALGTVDQHSQLQLYLDGPKDKFFTVLTMTHGAEDYNLKTVAYTHSALKIFENKSMGHLMMAEQQATIDSLNSNGCPTRVIHVNKLDAATLGALMIHYVLETLAMAQLTAVDPFDQPAVEEIKIKTRHYLEAL